MLFGEWLRLERAKKNISASELSKKLGKSRNYISQMEGRTNAEVPEELLNEITEILGIDAGRVTVHNGKVFIESQERKLLLEQIDSLITTEALACLCYLLIHNNEEVEDFIKFPIDIEESKQDYVLSFVTDFIEICKRKYSKIES